jgi:6-phosphogluconate dehydrogenase (decarboxylating)
MQIGVIGLGRMGGNISLDGARRRSDLATGQPANEAEAVSAQPGSRLLLADADRTLVLRRPWSRSGLLRRSC